MLSHLLDSLSVESKGSVVYFFVFLVIHGLHALGRLRVFSGAHSRGGEVEGVDDWGLCLLVLYMKHLEACSEEVRNIISK